MERKSLISRPEFIVYTKENILETKCQSRMEARLNVHMFGREPSDYFDKARLLRTR